MSLTEHTPAEVAQATDWFALAKKLCAPPGGFWHHSSSLFAISWDAYDLLGPEWTEAGIAGGDYVWKQRATSAGEITCFPPASQLAPATRPCSRCEGTGAVARTFGADRFDPEQWQECPDCEEGRVPREVAEIPLSTEELHGRDEMVDSNDVPF